MAGDVIEGVVPDADIEAVLGAPIGNNGSAREAKAYLNESSRVVKVSTGRSHASNQTEWFLWTQVADTSVADVLGRCFAISESGKYLVMEYLRDLTEAEKQNSVSCPSWVTDRKPSAFGVSANGKVKLRDYGQVNLPPDDGQGNFGAVLAKALSVSLPLKADDQMESWARLFR